MISIEVIAVLCVFDPTWTKAAAHCIQYEHNPCVNYLQGDPKELHKVYAPQFCNRTSVMRFSAKCAEINSLHDKGQCLNTAIKYSLFCSWQVKYLKTKLTEKSLR